MTSRLRTKGPDKSPSISRDCEPRIAAVARSDRPARGPRVPVARARTHERRLAALERAITPPDDLLLVVPEAEAAAARVAHPRAHILEIRCRGAGAPSTPQSQAARDASRAGAHGAEVPAARRRADGKADLDAGPDPSARERAEAQVRSAEDKLAARAASALAFLGADAFGFDARVAMSEAMATGRTDVATWQTFEADRIAFVALRAEDLHREDVRALLARVEAAMAAAEEREAASRRGGTPEVKRAAGRGGYHQYPGAEESEEPDDS